MKENIKNAWGIAKTVVCDILNAVKTAISSVISWQWVKRIVHWIIYSAGTISELGFLAASLWMSLNSSVHNLILLFVDEKTSLHISEFAVAAYVALPELIVALAVVVTIGHVKLWVYNRKNFTAAIWAILYGLPTLAFLALSLITIGCGVAAIQFQMPTSLVVVRALAGYMFAFTSLLYTQLGLPQERERLAKKDEIIADLSAKSVSLQAEIDGLKAELNHQKQLLVSSKNAQTELIKAVNKSSEDALEAYGHECIEWLRRSDKSVLIDEIIRYTGHSARKIDGAITKGLLQTTPRNKKLILVTSLVEWLKNTPPVSLKVVSNDEETVDKLDLALQAVRANPNITDEDLAPMLGLKRPASARFWRLKAEEMIRVGERNTDPLETVSAS